MLMAVKARALQDYPRLLLMGKPTPGVLTNNLWPEDEEEEEEDGEEEKDDIEEEKEEDASSKSEREFSSNGEASTRRTN